MTVTTSGTLSPSSADIVAGDIVTIALPTGGITTGTMADKHAGNDKAVVVDGLHAQRRRRRQLQRRRDQRRHRRHRAKPLTAGLHRQRQGLRRHRRRQRRRHSADIIAGDAVTIVGGGLFTGSGAHNVGNDKAIASAAAT